MSKYDFIAHGTIFHVINIEKNIPQNKWHMLGKPKHKILQYNVCNISDHLVLSMCLISEFMFWTCFYFLDYHWSHPVSHIRLYFFVTNISDEDPSIEINKVFFFIIMYNSSIL